MSSGEESNREEDFAIVNLENVKRISETYKPRRGSGKDKRGTITKAVVQEIWKDRLSPRFYSRLMSVMFPEDSNEVSFLSFYTIYKNLAEPETEVMFRALTIYHIATIHEPPFNYEQANEYPNASYKAIKDYVCDVITSYLHAIIQFNMKEAYAWLELRASNTLIDGNLVASYMLKDLETHRNEVSIGSLEIWLEKNEMYYTVSEQLYLYLFGVNSCRDIKPLIPLPVVQTGKATKTLLALPDVLLLNSKLPRRATRWTLAYMLDSRSQNWESLKNAIYGKSQTIIVIQDANGDIFGMYGSQRWFPSEGFFGNNECFLFTLKPDVNIYEGSGRDNNFQLFTESGIGMGGTAGRMGIFIQSNALNGSTSLVCSTFREFWPLARELEFKINQIEIWAVNDEQAQSLVEQDVGKLISNTQYVSMTRDEECTETNTLEQPKNKQPQDVPVPVYYCVPEPSSVAMCGPQRCWGECSKNSHPKNDPKYSPGRVCCSKKCTMKTRVNINRSSPRGEGDGNAKVRTVHCYPQQEEERLQCQHKSFEDKVKTKRVNRWQRISFDARQKHDGAGFIHPSLAAEENARNAKAAAEEDARNTKAVNRASPTPVRTNTSVTSRKRTPSPERELGQNSKSPTFTHTQTQVGESRLVKQTNKCACVVKKTCRCTTTENILPSSSKNENEYIIKATCTSYTGNEMTWEEHQKTNVFISEKISKTNRNLTVHRSNPINGIPAESSSTVLIEVNSCSDVKNPPVPSTRRISAMSESNRQGHKSKEPRIEKEKLAKKIEPPTNQASNMMSPQIKSEAYRKQEKVREGNQEDKLRNDNSKKILAYTVRSGETNDVHDYSQAELDCHCSSSSDCNDAEEETKKGNPASMCSCETKLSNYLTKVNREDISSIPLNEISSSVCSCILDHKNKVTASLAEISVDPSKKETQNLIKSRRRSDESARTVPIPSTQTKIATSSKKLCTTSHNSSWSSKNETQILTKSRRVSRASLSSVAHSNEGPQPVPPTCLRCRTLVGQQGCQCSAKCVLRNEVTSTPIQTSSLQQKELGWDTLKNAGSGRSVVIDTDALSFISGGEKAEQGTPPLSESTPTTSSKNDINKVSSEPSQVKQAPTKSCKTLCKCSLSPSYFPAFPEDLIKEGGTEDDCDCASYTDLRFPVVVETPPELSTDPSSSLRTRSASPSDADGFSKQEGGEDETKDTKCGCDDNDNTIIILNVSKCNTAETVEKIIKELEVKAGDASNPNVKSLIFRSKDLTSTMKYTLPCTAKDGPGREALRQHLEKILKIKNPTQTQAEPEQEDESDE